MLKKKIWGNFQRIIKLFTQKLSRSSQKYGFGIRVPGSGKNLFRIPDPGVKKAPDPGSTTLQLKKVNLHGAPVESLSPEHSAEGAVVLQSHLGHCKL